METKRIVLITGSSRGIGRALALKCAVCGDTVIINYQHDDEAAQAVLRKVKKSGGDGIVVRGNVARAYDVKNLFKVIKNTYGKLDVVINNAGVTSKKHVISMTSDEFDRVISINLKGTFLIMKEALRLMIAQRAGHVINISSFVGVKGSSGQSHYAASKAAVIGLSKSAAQEYGKYNIKVNVVLPGLLKTDMGLDNTHMYLEKTINDNCLERLSDLDEIAESVYELSGKNNISGQVYNLDSRIL
ncbi:MAG: SDR family NAD(P)-dependent oxidoreductase [Candidatus Ancaeobacter aquaticus]|nr:SDR family NAD(P)-dependent oxidoreductase [Candidatus Ancaeobacter aquaticus]